MARSYHSPGQLISQSCFFSPLDDHNYVLLDLSNSVAVVTTSSTLLIPIPDLTALLIDRYGGAPDNWRMKIIHQGYLVKIPDWVYPDDMFLDYELWEGLQLVAHPWQCVDSSPLPPSQRVNITIKDFPQEFWHPFYFRQVVASMGTLVGVSSEALRGRDRTTVRLLIECYDLNLIPFTLTVGHKGRWTECPVELDSRPPNTAHQKPPPSPPPSPPQSIHGDENNPDPFYLGSRTYPQLGEC